MKINQILIFQAMSHFPLNFASPFNVITYFLWNFPAETLYAFDKKILSMYIFSLLSALIIVHPIPHAIFENTSSGFIQILHHCSVPWKITPLYYFSSNLIYFGQKETIRVKFLDFWVVGWKFTKFLKSYLKPQVSFSLNFASIFSVMKDHSFVLF